MYQDKNKNMSFTNKIVYFVRSPKVSGQYFIIDKALSSRLLHRQGH